MPRINVNDRTITCKSGDNLYKSLLQGGIELNAPCGGAGTCGKCNVWVEGVGVVKSCKYLVYDDITVSVDKVKSKIITSGMIREISIDTTMPCIAVDIGTTTVAVYLIEGGEIIDTESEINAQKSYGDDVLSRINYTAENQEGTEQLCRLINNQIKKMVATLCERNNLSTDNIAISGNTTMLHLYANISPISIGVAPFTPVFTEIKKIGNTTLLPSISGYVGADMVAAILASGMHLSDKTSLLIDIGTNGEIALGNKNGIITCATAAGPAFEGAQITCGVGSISGAINSIKVNSVSDITYTTIDNAPPIGLCGSGILDVIAQMLRIGLIDTTGYFEGEVLNIAENVFINSEDIRQTQLAKAAIAAGINVLLKESGTKMSEIENCYLAGGFGSYLNKQSACDIGLIPYELIDRINSLGNAAGMGTVSWQVSDKCKDETDYIVQITNYIELSNSNVFNEEFMNCMYFD